MNGIRHALAVTAGERYFTIVINFVTLAVVSRLLTPAEIGVGVLGMAILMLALSFREFATTNFLVQRKELKLEDVRATTTVLFLITAATSFLIVLSAGGLAAFYEESNLAPYLRIISFGILIEVFSAPIAALLRREMAFGKLAFINVTRVALNAGVTILLASLGFSYMSFAWAFLVSEAVAACLSLLIWPDRSIFKPSLGGLQPMVAFGGYNGTNVLLGKIYESLPYLALGRILSVDAVGLYSRGLSICQLPDKVLLGGLTPVLLSVFSAQVRKGHELRDYYLRSCEFITAVQWPALVLLVILADPVVRTVLGDQWLSSVPLIRIIAIASLFSFSHSLTYPTLVAVGAMRDLMRRSIIVWPTSAGIICCAALFGLTAAALSWLLTMPFQAYVSIYFVRRHIAFDWKELGSVLWKSAILTLCSALGPLTVVASTGDRSGLSLDATCVAILLSAIGWGLGLWVTAHPLLSEIQRALPILFRTSITEYPAAIRMHLQNKAQGTEKLES